MVCFIHVSFNHRQNHSKVVRIRINFITEQWIVTKRALYVARGRLTMFLFLRSADVDLVWIHWPVMLNLFTLHSTATFQINSKENGRNALLYCQLSWLKALSKYFHYLNFLCLLLSTMSLAHWHALYRLYSSDGCSHGMFQKTDLWHFQGNFPTFKSPLL